MRKMLLSFRADVYERILSGEKIYEHRNVFPDEPIEAYLYVSKPMQCITGKVVLNNRILISSWKDKYSYDEKSIERINKFIESQKYVMEIKEFRETTKISLNKLRTELDRFVIPQMYYYLDNTELLTFIEENIKETGHVISHIFDNTSSDLICIH